MTLYLKDLPPYLYDRATALLIKANNNKQIIRTVKSERIEYQSVINEYKSLQSTNHFLIENYKILRGEKKCTANIKEYEKHINSYDYILPTINLINIFEKEIERYEKK